jgi:AraC-like DNA-binding protein
MPYCSRSKWIDLHRSARLALLVAIGAWSFWPALAQDGAGADSLSGDADTAAVGADSSLAESVGSDTAVIADSGAAADSGVALDDDSPGGAVDDTARLDSEQSLRAMDDSAAAAAEALWNEVVGADSAAAGAAPGDTAAGPPGADEDAAQTRGAGSRLKQGLAGAIALARSVAVSAMRAAGELIRAYRLHVTVLGLSAAMIFLSLLAWIRYDNRRNKKRFMTTTRLSVMDKEVRKAARFIEKRYSDPELGAASICEALITGPAFLEALFQRELGMSVEDFIAQVRVNRAMGVMQSRPETPLEEIAQQCGFRDVHAMREAFVAVTGSDPDQVRAAHAGKDAVHG